MIRLEIILLTTVFLLSCGTNKNRQPEERIISNDNWTLDRDTIAEKILISYKYPNSLVKDFIQNGICFGHPASKEDEFPNDMKLCIWFNDEKLENVDTIINSEGRFPFIAKTQKVNIKVDDKDALSVQYLNDKKAIVKQLIILKDQGTIYQIIAKDIDSSDFEYFIDNLKIETTNH